MSRRKRLVSTLHSGRALGLGVVCALIVLALVLAPAAAQTSASPDASAPEPAVSGAPEGDDVPEAALPPGEARAGEAGDAPAPVVSVVADQLLVKFEEGTPKAVAKDVLADAGVDPESGVGKIGARVVEVAPEEHGDALAALASSPAVEYAESDVVLQLLDTVPNDSRWRDQWGATKVSAPKAWDSTRGSGKVVIAVLDTGVDFGHPDLKGASVPGFDLVNNDANPSDDHGHGTAAAGVIAARTNNRAGLAGICWTCSLMSVKVLDAGGAGSTSTIARGIAWATDHGARVINLSLGGAGTTRTLADAVEYAVGKGVLLVAAAGNEGTSTPFYPAAYPAVVGVAGSTSSDGRYGWSNYGSWVQVAAPGCNVAPMLGGKYGTFCGTSSATPVVAGLAGLALSAKPSASAAEVEQAINKTVSPVGSMVQYGRVNAAKTLSAFGAGSVTAASASASAEGVITRQSPKTSFRHTVAAGQSSLTLTFSGARKVTLSVVSPSGKTVRRVQAGSPLQTAVTLAAGTYTFVVKGDKVRRAPFTLRLSYPSAERP
jgi:subtilisin family serine protease